jgi:4'-phosphopantetheinyl transferase
MASTRTLKEDNGPRLDPGVNAYPQLGANQVHVWRISLTAPEQSASVLSNDELQRAQRFHFEKDRLRFVAARSILRNILASYLDLPPREFAFSYTPKGKPELAAPLHQPALRFNLSHSGDFALLALALNSRVGADIEFMNPERATDAIAARFFSPAEISTLEALPAAERVAAFFQCWTRKEAYIKALGEGLSLPLDSFDVAFGPGVQPAILGIRNTEEDPSRWRLYDIASPRGYAAAIAVESQSEELHLRIWNAQNPDHN